MDAIRGVIWGFIRDVVRDAFWDAIWDTIPDTIRDAIPDAVWDAIRDAVPDAFWDAIWDVICYLVWQSLCYSGCHLGCHSGYILGCHLGHLFLQRWVYSFDPKTSVPCPNTTIKNGQFPCPAVSSYFSYSITLCPTSVHLSSRPSPPRGLSCVRFSSKGIKLWILKPLPIYSWHIVVVHLVFGLSKNTFIWSNLRSRLRPFLAHKDLLNEVLCALLLQRDKAVDFETYADLFKTYCSCAPRIRFVQKYIYLVKFEVKT